MKWIKVEKNNMRAIFVFEFRLKNFRYNKKKNKKVNKICEEYNTLIVKMLKE